MLRAVRDGKKGPFICPECECRLNVVSYNNDLAIAHHFTHKEEESKDAQGHKCQSIGKIWTVNYSEAMHLLGGY